MCVKASDLLYGCQIENKILSRTYKALQARQIFALTKIHFLEFQ